MNRSLVLLVGFSTLLPLAVEVPPDSEATDPMSTRFRLSGGTGYYAFITRGCDNTIVEKVGVKFRDASMSLEQDLGPTPLAVGARAGWLRDRVDTSTLVQPGIPPEATIHNRYVNPYLTLDPGPYSFGIGYVFHESEFITASESRRTEPDHPFNDVSFHLRAGRIDQKYFLLQWMEGEPLYSEGGYLTALIGGRKPELHLDILGGLGAGGPYEGAGLLFRARYDIPTGTRLHAAVRTDLGGSAGAWGASLGLEQEFPARKR